MHLLSKLVSSALVLVISLVTFAFILSGTLLNANYFKAKATELHLYDQLATSLSDTLSHDDASIKPALQGIISAQYVQQKLNPYLDQLQAYYLSNGSAPQIDFSDFVAEAHRQGIDVPAGSGLDKPVVFSDPTGLRQWLGYVGLLKTVGLAVALLLATGLVALNRGFRRFSALAKALIIAAIWEGVICGLFKLAPNLLESLIKSNKQVGPITPVLLDFFKAVLGDISYSFGIVAIGLAVAGVLLLIAGLIFKAKGLLKHHSDGDDSTRFVRPTPDNRPGLH